MSDIVIVSANRTAIGSFNGSLSNHSAAGLGELVIRDALRRTKIAATEIDDVILGNVLTAGQGMNPARQAALNAGLPHSSTAMTVNQVCGSGLRAVALAMQALKTGDSRIVIAGGQESMSNSHHSRHLRNGIKMGGVEFVDTMIHDGLTDIFNHYHMGITAENIAKEFNISRQTQDEFALNSQKKAEAAIQARRFSDEITPVSVIINRVEKQFDTDEYPRIGATLDSLAKLKPAFDKNGTVTAGNASGLNDGAACVILMTADMAAKRGLKPIARIASWATAGVDPKIMGTGPVPASKKALANAGWKVQDLDLIEANEAFASQAISVNQQMGWDPLRVNVNGGAIAMGHPIGASGARILVSLLHEMSHRSAKKGLATLCIGGGMGIAMCLER